MGRKPWKLALSVILALLPLSMHIPLSAPVQAVETRNLIVLGTSDIHGNVDNYDYIMDSVPTGMAQRGLTKVMSYVNSVRAGNPDTVLIDNGDSIQGTPLSYYFDTIGTTVENPLARAMNAMAYDAASIGDHEFNYGHAALNKFHSEAQFPLLSANIGTDGSDYQPFAPYTIKDVGGVQVGILGLSPPAIARMEKPEYIRNLAFADAMTAARQYVPEMRAAGADVIVVAAHGGLDEAAGYGREENFARCLANEVPGIDVILAGHAHAVVASQTVNGVLITEPGYQGRNVSDIRLTVSGSGNDWTVTVKSATAPAIAGMAENPGLLALMNPYHDATVAYVNTPIGTATAAFPGGFMARISDGPMADLINQVQTEAAAAAGFPVQASCAALFTSDARLNEGTIKVKDTYAIYAYDNSLYVIEATGQMIRDALEWTADYFNQYFYEPGGVTVNSKMRDYNYDLWSGIQYTLDVTKPVGQRVVELKLNGQSLAMDQVIRVALNNYRAAGAFPTATRLYQSTADVRDLITSWIVQKGTIAPGDVFRQNFRLVPPPNVWLPDKTGVSVTRSDNAELLWTAFGRSPGDYMVLPQESKKLPSTLTREGEFFLLGNKCLENLRDVKTDMDVLRPYSDRATISSWAKSSAAFIIQAAIFVSGSNKIEPKKLVTNAEALALVREARYPLYTFLSTNDFHGQLETGKLVSGKLAGGAAYNMSYINQYRALNPLGTSLFDAGDIMQGTPISSLLKGSSTIDVYNNMGYRAATFGNHEFDWGLDILQARVAQAEFPFLLANVFLEGTDTRPAWLKPSALLTIKGQQVGVIGVTSEKTPETVLTGGTAGLSFRAPGPVVSQLAAELRVAGADLVVVLAHMPDVYGGAVTQEMPTVAVPGVDLIISGSSHSGYTGKVNGIPIIQQYSSGTAIGVSDLRYDRLNRSIALSSLKVVTTYNAGIVPDAGIAGLVSQYQAAVAPMINQVKATTTGTISKLDCNTRETPLGNLIADAQAWKGGTQIAFMNPGGIKADIAYTTYPHNVTYGDFLAVQPFDNKLVTMNLTGSQIYALLEQQFSPPQSSMRLLQASGIRYSFNVALPAGSRIVSLTLADGTPILPDSTPYTVTCNEFIAAGGDGFTAFRSGTSVIRTGISDLDALIEYVQFRFGTPPANTPIDPTVYPTVEGRISNVTP